MPQRTLYVWHVHTNQGELIVVVTPSLTAAINAACFHGVHPSRVHKVEHKDIRKVVKKHEVHVWPQDAFRGENDLET